MRGSSTSRLSDGGHTTGLLDALDESLLRIRRVFQRPGYRTRLLKSLSSDLELAILRLLRAVQRAEQPPSVGAVAEQMAVDPSTASRLVEGAVEAGYLERHACADDRRRARLALTTQGTNVLAEVTERRRQLLAEVTGAWNPEELNQLIELLAKLQADFDRLERSS